MTTEAGILVTGLQGKKALGPLDEARKGLAWSLPKESGPLAP